MMMMIISWETAVPIAFQTALWLLAFRFPQRVEPQSCATRLAGVFAASLKGKWPLQGRIHWYGGAELADTTRFPVQGT